MSCDGGRSGGCGGSHRLSEQRMIWDEKERFQDLNVVRCLMLDTQ